MYRRSSSINHVSTNPPLITSFRPILWGSKIDKAPPCITFDEATAEDDRGLLKWLSNIVCQRKIPFKKPCLIHLQQDRFGFCFVSGVPATPEATEELSKRIAFIRETQCQWLIILCWNSD